jgi:hypothetical protein
MRSKKTDPIGVRMEPADEAALQRIARTKKTTAVELLRRAGVAIVNYAERRGDKAVPFEMVIADPAEVEGETLPFPAIYFLMPQTGPIAIEYAQRRLALIAEIEEKLKRVTGITDPAKSIAEQAPSHPRRTSP